MKDRRFKLGQRVYHVLGGELNVGIVTGIVERTGQFEYLVTWRNHEEETCFDLELGEEPVRDFAD